MDTKTHRIIWKILIIWTILAGLIVLGIGFNMLEEGDTFGIIILIGGAYLLTFAYLFIKLDNKLRIGVKEE